VSKIREECETQKRGRKITSLDYGQERALDQIEKDRKEVENFLENHEVGVVSLYDVQ